VANITNSVSSTPNRVILVFGLFQAIIN
jgi:hypothetical protein